MTAPTSPIPSRRLRSEAAPTRRRPEPEPLEEPEDVEDLEDLEPPRSLGWVLTVGGLVAAVAAFVLTLEKLALLENPAYVPSCSIDPVLSCGSVMRTDQAAVFGFPNPLIGMAVLPIVAVFGVLVLSRVEVPRWMWLGLQLGATAGVAFVGWLIYQSTSVIEALCPYCMVVWACVIPIFWLTTAHNIDSGTLAFGAPGEFLARHRYPVLAVLILAVVVVVVASFPDYFGAMVGL